MTIHAETHHDSSSSAHFAQVHLQKVVKVSPSMDHLSVPTSDTFSLKLSS